MSTSDELAWHQAERCSARARKQRFRGICVLQVVAHLSRSICSLNLCPSYGRILDFTATTSIKTILHMHRVYQGKNLHNLACSLIRLEAQQRQTARRARRDRFSQCGCMIIHDTDIQRHWIAANLPLLPCKVSSYGLDVSTPNSGSVTRLRASSSLGQSPRASLTRMSNATRR